MTLPANFAGLRALPLAPAVVAAAKDLRRRGATAVIVVAHVGGSCTRFTAIRRSRVVRIRQRDLPARARVARGHRRRDRRGPHARRDRPPRRRHPDHRDLRQGPRLRAHRSGGRSRAPGRPPAVVDARIFPPQAVPKPGLPFGGSYEGAPLAPDAAVAAAIAPALAAARARREAPLGVTLARPIAPFVRRGIRARQPVHGSHARGAPEGRRRADDRRLAARASFPRARSPTASSTRPSRSTIAS